MNGPLLFFLLALAISPFAAYAVYRLARGLGFLDPPWNREHEYRRTIITALYAFLLFFSVFLFGYGTSWPRIWVIFGVVNAVALLFFAAVGYVAARKLWRLRHWTEPTAPVPEPPALAPGGAEEKPLV